MVEDKGERALSLRRGDFVRLRPIEQIVTTLDAEGRTDLLPFMGEMLAMQGKPFVVDSRADKTCDTITMSGVTRSMENTVHLAGARCDGSAHGGCQAHCLLYFKEAWLEVVPSGSRPSTDTRGPEQEQPPAGSRAEDLEGRLHDYAHASPDHYRCQATQMLEASQPLVGHRHFLEDIRTRNVPLRRLLLGLVFTAINRYQRISRRLPARLRIAGGHRLPDVRGTVRDGQWPPYEPLNLQPGDLVEVRSKEEIRATLDDDQRNRGLWFDEEMARLCGKRGRVLHRVERLIDEKSGRMLRVRKDLFVVDGMLGCEGIYHSLCTRSVIGMLREAWLRRVD